MEQSERRGLDHSYDEDMSHDEQLSAEFELAHTIENRMLEHEQEREEQRNQILKTYHDVWDEFYEWEPEPCCSVVRSLQCALVESVEGTSVPLHFSDESMDTDEVDGNTFEVFDIEQDRLCRLDPDIVHVPAFTPHPKYEACTPASQNIRNVGYPRWLDFIPYADEGFPAWTLLHGRRYFHWQDVQRDPDACLIELRTIHILESQPFSYNVINAHSVLPRLFDRDGLIGRFSSRDLWHLPHWPELPELPCTPLDEYIMKTQINEYVDKMCPHMGCLYNLCLLHNDIAEPFSGNIAHVRSGIIKQKIQRPCGEMCCTLDRVQDSFLLHDGFISTD
ncbi:hypothetical protein DAEQUDRAFT_445187 [Daedalea quercina L-15889]|uniref:Uncharacterized protein n=1 Tax=Daedalea quercina L-15889 TaxID=1314783 RepID=A0A165N7J5_9APHY|nr:hypothetical protein DAEQUDRAFT_445187 [Daedalea quercina L-15889]